jgi:hypothetical protein
MLHEPVRVEHEKSLKRVKSSAMLSRMLQGTASALKRQCGAVHWRDTLAVGRAGVAFGWCHQFCYIDELDDAILHVNT